ncbi:E3 ubiquitin-protein ligase TRIM39 isoform X2 [Astyanax mexicanus]|uniref:E3 ubiquitin-protein ligase TRIM39 isoform X2 n=1 Tax=Astyanax mexicanus TaxID=7994 RepID=UPI000BBD79EA|nr:E3 ubiquitin-protein ligase TRIM39 isoform X2 [Astyanax mexicanus]
MMMDRPESPSSISLASERSVERPINLKQEMEPQDKRKSDKVSETLSYTSEASDWSEDRLIKIMEPLKPKSKKAERSESVLSDWSVERPINFRETKSPEVMSLVSGRPSEAESGRGSMETDSSWDLTYDIISQEHRQRSVNPEFGDTACDLCGGSQLQAHILLLENDQLKKMIKDLQSENLRLKQMVGELKLPDYIRRGKTPAAANLTLNPDTAHSALLLSNDGKRVRLGDCITVLQSAQRFDKFECVLAREGFSSGRHYWEVEVNREFTIGVTRQSAQRKGKFTFCPSEGYWCLYHFRQVFTALDESTQRLQVDSVPRVLGVCIDVDEKWVIFYNTETKAQVYIFRNMAFTDGEKIYPLFNTLEKSVCLVIRTAR